MPKRAINGLKLSQPMSALQLRWAGTGPNIFAELCSLFTEAQINLAYCTTAFRGGHACSFCCIDSGDQARAEKLAERLEQSVQFLGWFYPAAILHFYPHHSSLRMLGQALEALAGCSIGVYAFSSSISSLSLVVDYGRLDAACDALMSCFHLPENFSPVVAERVVRQILPAG